MVNLVVFKLGGSLLDLPELTRRLRIVLDQRPDCDPLIVVGGGAAADAVRDQDRRQSLGDERAHWLAIDAMESNSRLLAAMLPMEMTTWGMRACRSAVSIIVNPQPRRGAIRQPRAQPWVSDQYNPQAPTGRDSDRRNSESLESRPDGASFSSWNAFPRAAPWAIEFSPVGAGTKPGRHSRNATDAPDQCETRLPQCAILLPTTFLRRAESSSQAEPLPRSWDVTSDSIAAWVARFVGASELVLLKSTSLPEQSTFGDAAASGLVDPCFPRVAAHLARISWCNLREPEPRIVAWRPSFAAEPA